MADKVLPVNSWKVVTGTLSSSATTKHAAEPHTTALVYSPKLLMPPALPSATGAEVGLSTRTNVPAPGAAAYDARTALPSTPKLRPPPALLIGRSSALGVAQYKEPLP